MSNNNQEAEFQTIKSKRGPGPRGQRIQNKNNQDRKERDQNDQKPRLSFKELLFELNNLKKHQHSPKVDLLERDNTYFIRVELPGLSYNDVNVQLRDGQFLLISGNKQNQNMNNDNTIYSECYYGNFMRRVKVPAPIDRHSIKTSMSNGILVLTVDKLPQVEETLDSRLDEEYVTKTELEPIHEGKVLDFSTLGDFKNISWADEI
jgi:HSP20 family molecular chaperone IbpA